MTDIRRHRMQDATVLFGSGAFARLPEECRAVGLSRMMVISTPGGAGLASEAGALLGERAALLWPHARMHVPQSAVEAGLAALRNRDIDGLLAVGGGSAVGLAKALAFESGLPIVAVPTTYSGSEMTPLYGVTSDGHKRTGRDERVRPRLILYDPDLTLNLSARVSAASGLNAIAHAMESLWAPDATPLSDALALEACRLLVRALPGIQHAPADPGLRNDALAGAWLAGTCLGSVTMGLHHKLCHVLGGAYDLAHAETHAILIGHVARLLLPAVAGKTDRLAGILKTDDPARHITELPARLGLPTTLAALGMPRAGIGLAVSSVLEAGVPGPVSLDRGDLEQLLAAAWAGDWEEGNAVSRPR